MFVSGENFVFIFNEPLFVSSDLVGEKKDWCDGNKEKVWKNIFIMAPATNWLSFSLSPMEMLRSSESQFMAYDNTSTASPQYLIDNFYANGNASLLFNLYYVFLSYVWLPRNRMENAYYL